MWHNISPVQEIDSRWQSYILWASTIAVILITIICLSHGITTVFPHIYYIPIVLAAYWYKNKGLIFSALLGLAYVTLVFLFTGTPENTLTPAVLRIVVFMGIAAVVAYLSGTLERSECEYRTIFENTGTAMAILDCDLNVLKINSEMEHLSGCSEKDVRDSVSFLTCIQEEDRDAIKEKYRERIENRDELPQVYDYTILDKTGCLHDVISTVTVLPGTQNCVTSLHDTTEINMKHLLMKTQRDIALGVSDVSSLNEAVKLCVDIIVEISGMDSGGFYLFDNRTRGPHLIYSTGCSDEWRETVEYWPHGFPGVEMLRQGRPLYLRYDEMKNAGEFVRKEGIRSAVAIPVFNKGEVIGCYTLASHTLEEVPQNIRPLIESIAVEVGIAIVHGQTEQILKEKENELYRLFNTIDDLVFVLDRNTRILRTNQTVLETLGYSHEELQKMNISDLCQPKEKGGIIKSFSGIYDGKKDSHSCTFITKSGKKLTVETHTTPGHWNNTDVIFAISRDMTERIRTEKAIRNINSKLNLLSSITRHDILNQITALSGIIFLLQKVMPDDQKIRKYVGLLKDISDTIQEQVTFTRDYQDLGVNCPAWQRVKPLFEKVKADDPFTDIELAIDTGHLEVFADPMLERVFFNLIDNAARHGQHVTKMSVTFYERDGEGIVVVQDNGAGIPANIKKDVFEKGFGSNTGLGLFLTKEILEITGISIEETGAKGQGAKFLLHIPAGEWRICKE